jgi:hypothetical protein
VNNMPSLPVSDLDTNPHRHIVTLGSHYETLFESHGWYQNYHFQRNVSLDTTFVDSGSRGDPVEHVEGSPIRLEEVVSPGPEPTGVLGRSAMLHVSDLVTTFKIDPDGASGESSADSRPIQPAVVAAGQGMGRRIPYKAEPYQKPDAQTSTDPVSKPLYHHASEKRLASAAFNMTLGSFIELVLNPLLPPFVEAGRKLLSSDRTVKWHDQTAEAVQQMANVVAQIANSLGVDVTATDSQAQVGQEGKVASIAQC